MVCVADDCMYVRKATKTSSYLSLSLSLSRAVCVCATVATTRAQTERIEYTPVQQYYVLYSGGVVTRRNGKQYEKLCDLCCTWRLEGAPPVRGLYPTAEAAWGLKEARTTTAVAIAVKLLRITARALLCTLALIETSPPTATASSSVLLSRFLDSSLWRSAESLLL